MAWYPDSISLLQLVRQSSVYIPATGHANKSIRRISCPLTPKSKIQEERFERATRLYDSTKLLHAPTERPRWLEPSLLFAVVVHLGATNEVHERVPIE
eukprot:SAG31_NODE_1137_length_9727_cov_40.714894_3_plen_98_part_00